MNGRRTGARPQVIAFPGRASADPVEAASQGASPPPAVEPPSEPVLEEVVINGRRYRLVEDVAPPAPEAAPGIAELLTSRELQIVMLVAEGRVNKQIAAELAISEWTVSTHLRRIFAKLGVDSRAAMVRKCLVVLEPLRR